MSSSGHPSRTGFPSIGARFVPWGDSVDAYTDTPAAWVSTWPHMFAALTCGRLEMVNNAGVSGNTTAQMLARFATDVAAFSPSAVALGNISNDIIQGVDPAVTRANIRQMITLIRSIGAVPILRSSVPYAPAGVTAAQRLQIINYNRWLAEQANLANYPFADFYGAVVDPATNGDYLAAYGQPDKIHPTAGGWAVLAQTMFAALFPGGVPGPAGLSASNTDPSNLVSNGLMLVDGNADGLADGFTVDQAPTSGTATPSIFADAWFRGGKAQRITYNAAVGGSGILQAPGAGWSVGDTLEFGCAVNLQIPGGYVQLSVQSFGGAGSLTTRLTSVQGRSVLRRRIVVPPATGGLLLTIDGGIATVPVSGTLDTSQVTCRNLTTGAVLL